MGHNTTPIYDGALQGHSKAAISAAHRRGTRAARVKLISRSDYLAYQRIINTLHGKTYSTESAAELARHAGCSADYVTTIHKSLNNAGLTWRAKVGNQWRTYVSYFEAEPAPGADPQEIDPPVLAPLAERLVQQAYTLLQLAASIADDPIAPVSAPAPAPERRPAAASDSSAPAPAGVFFVSESPDQDRGSTRSFNGPSPIVDSSFSSLGPPVVVPRSSNDPDSAVSAGAPPAITGGGGASLLPGWARRITVPDTQAVTLIEAFAAEYGQPVFNRAALARHADRPVADVQAAIAEARQRGGSSPVGLLLVILDEGPIGPARSRPGRAAPARQVVNYCASCGLEDPKLADRARCDCGADLSFTGLHVDQPRGLPPGFCICGLYGCSCGGASLSASAGDDPGQAARGGS